MMSVTYSRFLFLNTNKLFQKDQDKYLTETAESAPLLAESYFM